MSYFDEVELADCRMDAKCDPKYGWERKGNKCIRIKKIKPSTLIGVGSIAALGWGAYSLYRNEKARKIGRTVAGVGYALGASTAALDEKIRNSRLPEPAKKIALEMEGRTKRFLLESFFRLDDTKVAAIDKKNNTITFIHKKNTDFYKEGDISSITNEAESTLLFKSQKSKLANGSPKYVIDFTVDGTASRPSGGSADIEKGRRLARKTQAMFSQHLSMYEEGALLEVDIYEGDDAGKKRGRIYRRMGFSEIPNTGSHIFAMKKDGKLVPVPDNKKEEIADLIKKSKNRKDAMRRSDRISSTAKCDPRYGWKRQGDKCERVKKANGNKKGTDVQAALGIGATALGVTAFALPLMEARTKLKLPEGGVKIPDEGLSAERLENYKKEFKRGDLIKHKFKNDKTKIQGYHYGIYIGEDKETGKPQMLHVTGSPVRLIVSGMEPINPKNSWEYEKVEEERSISNQEIEARLKKVEPFIGKRVNYNILDNNCEAFARGILGEPSKSKQTESLSKISMFLGRSIYGSFITAVANKGARPEVRLKDIEKALNTPAEKKDALSLSTSVESVPNTDWSIFTRKTPDGKTVMISLEEALAISKTLPPNLKEIAVEYLKNYLLFMSAANTVAENKMKNDSLKCQPGNKPCGKRCISIKQACKKNAKAEVNPAALAAGALALGVATNQVNRQVNRQIDRKIQKPIDETVDKAVDKGIETIGKAVSRAKERFTGKKKQGGALVHVNN